MNIWIVVADSAKARILTADKSCCGLCEKVILEHPESRLREHDLTSDQPGRAIDSVGQGGHAMGKSVDPKKQEVIAFSKTVADYLEAGRNDHSFGKLYVIAPPTFLGYLRDQFSAPLAKAIAASIDKNLVDLDLEQIRSHLPEFL